MDTLVLDIEGDALDGIVIGSYLIVMRPRTGNLAHFALHGATPVARNQYDMIATIRLPCLRRVMAARR